MVPYKPFKHSTTRSQDIAVARILDGCTDTSMDIQMHRWTDTLWIVGITQKHYASTTLWHRHN